MIRRLRNFSLPLIVLTLFPTVAYANAGTPLMWATALHMLFGNALIGVAEGVILAILFRLRTGRCVGIMILANYFSAWVGGVFICGTIIDSVHPDLYSASRWLWGMVAISYGVTLLLEWPFIAFCLRRCERWFRKSVWGSLIVQTASYSVLFGWYGTASRTSLYSDFTIVPPAAISISQPGTLYYIAEGDRDVRTQRLGANDSQSVGALPDAGSNVYLTLEKSHSAPGRCDLVAQRWPECSSRSGQVLLPAVAAVAPDLLGWTAMPGDPVPMFSGIDKSGWQMRLGWMAGNLHGENAKNGRQFDLYFDTLFMHWRVRWPTQLPDGKVVFELGWSQICIVDSDQRKVALITKGRSPVVVLDDPEAPMRSDPSSLGATR